MPWSGVHLITEQDILPEDIALNSSAGHNVLAATTEPQVQVKVEQDILPEDIELEISACHNYAAVAATTEPQVQVKVEQEILPENSLYQTAVYQHIFAAPNKAASQTNNEYALCEVTGHCSQVMIDSNLPLNGSVSLVDIAHLTANCHQKVSDLTQVHLAVPQIELENVPTGDMVLDPVAISYEKVPVVSEIAVQHMQSIYQNHSCMLCPDKFFYKRHLTEHLLQRHGVISCPPQVRKSRSLKVGTSKPLQMHGLSSICEAGQLTLAKPNARIEAQNVCLEVQETFRDGKQLMQHLQTNHQHLLPHVCTFCEASFPYKNALEQHVKKLHSRVSVKKKKPVRKNIPCQFCFRMFSNGISLQTHLFSKHPLGVKSETQFSSVHACQFCAEKFSSTKNLRDHLFEQHPPDFECEHCPSKFRSQEMLDAHVKKHEEKPKVSRAPYVQKWKCCGQSFMTEEALEGHVKTHKVAPLMHCNECLKAYRCKKAISRHIVTHFMSYQCKVCGKKFVTHAYLRRHKRSCLKEELICMECGSKFSIRSKLDRHMDVQHYAEYKCRVCGKSFNKANKRRLHERTHTAMKAFSCETCQRSFYTKHILQKHRAVNHISTNKFECNFCNKVFNVKSSLTNHLVIHDSNAKKFICEYCDTVFHYRKQLVSHMLVHTRVKRFECKTCHKRFSDFSNMKKHVRQIHLNMKVKRLPCTQCDKNFSSANKLARHLYMHTGERPHGCDLCDLKFAQASQMREHKLMKHKVLPYECKKCGQRFKRIADMMLHLTEH